MNLVKFYAFCLVFVAVGWKVECKRRMKRTPKEDKLPSCKISNMEPEVKMIKDCFEQITEEKFSKKRAEEAAKNAEERAQIITCFVMQKGFVVGTTEDGKEHVHVVEGDTTNFVKNVIDNMEEVPAGTKVNMKHEVDKCKLKSDEFKKDVQKQIEVFFNCVVDIGLKHCNLPSGMKSKVEKARKEKPHSKHGEKR